MYEIEIIKPDGLPAATLKNIKDPLLTEEINGMYMFSFTSMIDENTSHISFVNKVVLDGQKFNIVKVSKRRSGAPRYEVECDHVSYGLSIPKNYAEEFDATPAEIVGELLSGTAFTTGLIEFPEPIYFKPGNKSIRECLIELANYLGGEIVWDNHIVDILDRRGSDKGLTFEIGKNLKDLSFITDMSEGVPRYALEVDALDLYHLPGYADFLEGLSSVSLGDDVRVLDPLLKVDIKQRVVKYERNPFSKSRPKISIGNVIRDITDYFREKEEEKEPEIEVQEILLSFNGSGSFSVTSGKESTEREKYMEVFTVGQNDVLSISGANVTNEYNSGEGYSLPTIKTPENEQAVTVKLDPDVLESSNVRVSVGNVTYTNSDFDDSGSFTADNTETTRAIVVISQGGEYLEVYGVHVILTEPEEDPEDVKKDQFYIEFGNAGLAGTMTYYFDNEEGYDALQSVSYGLLGATGYSSPITVVFRAIESGGKIVGVNGASNWAELVDVPDITVSMQAICKNEATETAVE